MVIFQELCIFITFTSSIYMVSGNKLVINITRHSISHHGHQNVCFCNWFLVAGQHHNDKETKNIIITTIIIITIIIIIIIDSIATNIYLQNYIGCCKFTDFMNQVQLLRPTVCCSEHISAF